MSYTRKFKCPRCFIVNTDDRSICRNCNTPLRGWRRTVTVKEHNEWNLYDKSQNMNKPDHYIQNLLR
ncbi:hypothetical protein, partial [[Eubacterium] cellulosolvens]